MCPLATGAQKKPGVDRVNRTKTSTEQSEQYRATLGCLAHKYANVRIDRTGFFWIKSTWQRCVSYGGMMM